MSTPVQRAQLIPPIILLSKASWMVQSEIIGSPYRIRWYMQTNRQFLAVTGKPPVTKPEEEAIWGTVSYILVWGRRFDSVKVVERTSERAATWQLLVGCRNNRRVFKYENVARSQAKRCGCGHRISNLVFSLCGDFSSGFWHR